MSRKITTVRMPVKLLAALDAQASRMGVTRTELMVRVLRDHLGVDLSEAPA